MATLSEHADAIKAAIKAAEDDGLKVAADVTRDPWDGTIVQKVELDVWGPGGYVTVYTEDWS